MTVTAKALQKLPRRWWLAVCILLPVLTWASLSAGDPVGELNEPGESATEPLSEEDPVTRIGESARAFLEYCGIDDSCFRQLADGRALHDDERGTLMRILGRLRMLQVTRFEQWAKDEFDLTVVGGDPESFRGKLFHLDGRVRRVDVCTPLVEVADRFDMPSYYRCQIELRTALDPAVIFTTEVPKAWPLGQSIDERVGVYGVFLKLAGSADKHPTPCFAASRLAWYPDNVLGDLEMDVALLDNVKDWTRRPITKEEREGFYQLMAAVGRAKRGQLARIAREALEASEESYDSIVPLFNEPASQRGRLVILRGRARRVVKIRVDDADIQERFGIDHYYEVDIVTEESTPNPITFCVREVPPEMPQGDGPEFSETVCIAGVFFKSWKFTSGAGKQQLAPMLLGRRAVWIPRAEPNYHTIAGAVAGGLFLLALLGLWVAMWRFRRGDKTFRERTFGKSFAVQPGVSLDEIGLPEGQTPDFSGIDSSVGDTPDGDGPDSGDSTV